jgi:hypothetical protein
MSALKGDCRGRRVRPKVAAYPAGARCRVTRGQALHCVSRSATCPGFQSIPTLYQVRTAPHGRATRARRDACGRDSLGLSSSSAAEVLGFLFRKQSGFQVFLSIRVKKCMVGSWVGNMQTCNSDSQKPISPHRDLGGTGSGLQNRVNSAMRGNALGFPLSLPVAELSLDKAAGYPGARAFSLPAPSTGQLRVIRLHPRYSQSPGCALVLAPPGPSLSMKAPS